MKYDRSKHISKLPDQIPKLKSAGNSGCVLGVAYFRYLGYVANMSRKISTVDELLNCSLNRLIKTPIQTREGDSRVRHHRESATWETNRTFDHLIWAAFI